jgi:hypothetical protein|eukprot:COSAG06_NODE_1188_length_10329_cov_4.747875_9_plen_38_part_00
MRMMRRELPVRTMQRRGVFAAHRRTAVVQQVVVTNGG